VHAFTLAVGPPSRVYRYRDWNDNFVHHFNVTRYHDRISVVSRALVTTRPAPVALAAVGDAAAAADPPYALLDFLQLRGPVRPSGALVEFERGLPRPAAGSLGPLVRALGGEIHRRFTYRKDVTRYDSTTDDFLGLGAGVCQDFAHLMLGTLRLRGIPARYVSGYLHVESPDEPAQSHAWIEFWSPTHGWVPFDPTHDREIDERYVVLGHGRDYDDVPPNKGIYRGNARETLRAEVRTRTAAVPRSAGPQEAVEGIDLPVFAAVPPRRADWDTLVLAEEAVQQQQQQ
jgi:transglutaminase-like putative cysteine protease